VPDGAEGAFDAGAPASVPLSYVKLNARDDAEGGGVFGARPPTCIPNKNMLIGSYTYYVRIENLYLFKKYH
jgi:hypothetical protein